MQSNNPFRFYIFLLGLLLAGSGQVRAATLPADVLSQLNSYNEAWTSPSTNGSPGSMPIGNGDITANVWVEIITVRLMLRQDNPAPGFIFGFGLTQISR